MSCEFLPTQMPMEYPHGCGSCCVTLLRKARLMFRICLLLLLVVPVAADDRPNLLVILADDLGYGDLACQGADDMRTPHLDRLFAEGMTFTNFYANCPVCSPHASRPAERAVPGTGGRARRHSHASREQLGLS